MAIVEDKIEFRAQARWVRTAPRKAQLVVEEIRGRTVPEAQVILAFMTRAAAKDVAGVLNSAVANAESHPLSYYSADDLYVAAAEVGTGPTLKRWRARARGRVGRIKKRTCHITIRLEPVEGAVAGIPSERPRRERKPKDEAAPAIDETTTPVEAGPESAVEAETEPETEAAVTEEAVEEQPAEPEAAAPKAVDETPAEPEAAAEESPAEEASAEEQTKPASRRSRRAAAEAEGPQAAEEPPAEDPKPRTRKKKTDEPAPESPAGEES
jgi:large subunit ribosomal protein L22